MLVREVCKPLFLVHDFYLSLDGWRRIELDPCQQHFVSARQVALLCKCELNEGLYAFRFLLASVMLHSIESLVVQPHFL
jgi:hypothetical protein